MKRRIPKPLDGNAPWVPMSERVHRRIKLLCNVSRAPSFRPTCIHPTCFCPTFFVQSISSNTIRLGLFRLG